MLRNIGQTDSGTHRLGSCMAVELFRTSDSLFVLAGYESGKVALWEIKETGKIIWTQQLHTEPGKILCSLHTNLANLFFFEKST